MSWWVISASIVVATTSFMLVAPWLRSVAPPRPLPVTLHGSASPAVHLRTVRWATAPVRRRLRANRRPIDPGLVAAWCESLARSVRIGTTLRHALVTQVPDDAGLRSHTEHVRRRLEQGVPVSAATDPAGTPTGGPDVELVWSVLSAVGSFGGSAAEPIDRVASTLRLRSADAYERRTQSAQAMASAHVLTIVPAAVLVVLAATDDDLRAVATSPTGSLLICAGLVLNLTGWWWMRRIIRGAWQ